MEYNNGINNNGMNPQGEEPPAQNQQQQQQQQQEQAPQQNNENASTNNTANANNNPLSMSLTDEECRWALAIKRAVMEDVSLEELSDFEYAQYALVTRGDTEAALYKIQGLQTFRHEYNIHDTLQEGLQLLRELHQQQPWFVLDVEYEPQHGHFVWVYDYAVVDPSKVRLPEEYRAYLGGLYYVFQLLQANLGSIREGLVHICECEGKRGVCECVCVVVCCSVFVECVCRVC